MRRWNKATRKSRSTSTISLRQVQDKLSVAKKAPARKGLPASDAVGGRFRGGLPRSSTRPYRSRRPRPKSTRSASSSIASSQRAKSISPIPIRRLPTRRAFTRSSRASRSRGGKTSSRACAPPRRSSCGGSPRILTIVTRSRCITAICSSVFSTNVWQRSSHRLIDGGARYRARIASLTGGPQYAEALAESTSWLSAKPARKSWRRDARRGVARGWARRRGRDRGARSVGADRRVAAPRRTARGARARQCGEEHAGGARYRARKVVLLSIFSGAACLYRGGKDAGRLSAAGAGQRPIRGAAAHPRSAWVALLSRERFDR